MSTRILHIAMTRSVAGIAVVQRNLYTFVDRDQVQFDFVATCDNPALEQLFISMGANIYRIPNVKNPIAHALALKKLIESHNYAVVHLHKNSCADIVAAVVCKLLGVKVVIVHAHNTRSTAGFLTDAMHFFNRPIMRMCMTHAIACSHQSALWLFGKRYCDKNDVMLLHNSIIADDFAFDEAKRNAIRNELNIDDQLVWGHVGRFMKQKNHAFLLSAFAEFVKMHEKSVLLLFGIGHLKGEIRRLAGQLEIADKVLFMGSKPDMASYYHAIDAFVMPSFHEGVPIAAVEAQASGVPCFLADTITDDIAISSAVHWLSLKDSPHKWALAVYTNTIDFVRVDLSGRVKDSGYDSALTAKKLEAFYLSAMQSDKF